MLTEISVVALLALAVLLVGHRIPVRYNARNLVVRWKTTLMTALAFTLVIGLFVVMLGFVNGMYRLTLGSGQPGNVIILSERATDEVVSNISPTDIGDLETQPGILRENGRPVASRETYLVINQPMPHFTDGRPSRRFLQVRGLDDPVLAGRVHNLSLFEDGGWFSEAGARQITTGGKSARDDQPVIEAVLGEGVARELGRDRTAEQLAASASKQRLDTGDCFELAGRQWLVVGVLQSAGSTFNSEIWAKRSLVASLLGKDTYTSLVVRTADEQAARELAKYFATRYKRVPVQAEVETEYYESLSNTNKQFLYAIVFVTVVMSLGGTFGVMNTMYAAISQRTADIGILRLLGYSRWQLLRSFLLESLLIAALGGVLGCGIGLLSDGLSATSLVSSGPAGGKSVVLRLAIDLRILSAGMLLALTMGVLGGVLPSLAAMRTRPLEALR
jgi:putative ABC transport system permease protein